MIDELKSSSKKQLEEFAKETANWLNGEILHLMNTYQIKDINDLGIPPQNLWQPNPASSL